MKLHARKLKGTKQRGYGRGLITSGSDVGGPTIVRSDTTEDFLNSTLWNDKKPFLDLNLTEYHIVLAQI